MLHRRLASPLRVAGLLLASCIVTPPAFAQSGAAQAAQAAHAGTEPRALLELFTSQGCSSCPAADRLLGELANDPTLVAVSVPIDYWDYLGWKDTLASPAHSARQRAYARMRGDRQVYTPQIVINGSAHVLGSDRPAIERVIAQTRRNAAIMALPLAMSISGGKLNVNAEPSREGRAGGEVWLCQIAKALPVKIGRGENHGRTVTYHNVVRHWLKLGEWTGKVSSWSVPVARIRTDDVDAAAVMIQDGTREKPGVILGAAIAQLH
jgi:hypothetical protein